MSSLISRNVRSLGVFLLLLLAGLQAQTAHFSDSYVALGSGFNFPTGVAVDGSGNVFVADVTNSQVYEMVAVNGSIPASPAIKTLGGGFSFTSPYGIAVDGNDNIYVAGYHGNAVYEIPASGGYNTVITLAQAYTASGGFFDPEGVAVDGLGDVFVADSGHGLVKEIVAVSGSIPSSPTVNTLAGNFTFGVPTGVAVDGFGDVFVADYGNSAMYEIVAVSGTISSSPTVNTLGGSFSFVNPTGVALDGNGNVFVADYQNNQMYEILSAGGYATVNPLGSGITFSSPTGVAVDGRGNVFVGESGGVEEVETASVDFGPVAVGQASGKLSMLFTFAAGGSIGKPVVLTQSVPGLDFADAGMGSCTTNGTVHTYNAGNTCTVDVTFTPTFAGLRNGAVVLANGSGTTIATGYIHGIGLGPQVSFLPGSQSPPLGSGFNGPKGVAVDGFGDVFVVDTGNNSVKEILAVGGSIPASPTIQTLASGLASPLGIALDGSGNVFFADAVNNEVKEILAVGGSIPASPTINIVGSGFARPQGPAVDTSGNVFIADTNDGAVKEILVAGGYTTVNTLASSFNYPLGVAVDGSGNVFVADTYNNLVKEIILTAGGNSTVVTIGSGFNFPTGIAVDANGNLFVADYGNNAVKEILASGGYSTVVTLGSGFSNPFSVAVDAGGNVYVADYGHNQVVKLDVADVPALTFPAPTPVGSIDTTDGPQTVTIQNIGNAPLTFQPFVPGNLLDAILTSSGETDCTTLSGLHLAPGVGCTLDIEFAPSVAGSPVKGFVNVVDNALNAASPNYATQKIAVQGTGVLANTSQTITFPNPGTQTYGAAPITLGATASSGLTVTYSVTSGPASVVGSTLTIAGPGSVTVQATQSGNGPYAAATPVSVSFTVNKAPLTVSGLTAVNKPYDGTTAATLSGTASLVGVVSGDTVTLVGTAVGTFASAGVGTGIAVNISGLSLSGASAANYTLTGPTLSANITQIVLTVIANNQAVAFGVAIPALTGTVTGVAAGDGITASYATTAAAGSPVGTYPITAKLNDPDSKLSNYIVSITNGSLVVFSSSQPLALWESQGSAVAGGDGFTLTVNGANFVQGSMVLWNGAVRTTHYVSSTQVTADILASDILTERSNLVTVANPAPNAATSAALPFAVQLSAPEAVITAAALSDAADGSGNYALLLTGTGFVPGSTVRWNGVDLTLTATYVNPWELSAVVTASEHAVLPSVVTVWNSGVTSAGFQVR